MPAKDTLHNLTLERPSCKQNLCPDKGYDLSEKDIDCNLAINLLNAGSFSDWYFVFFLLSLHKIIKY